MYYVFNLYIMFITDHSSGLNILEQSFPGSDSCYRHNITCDVQFPSVFVKQTNWILVRFVFTDIELWNNYSCIA